MNEVVWKIIKCSEDERKMNGKVGKFVFWTVWIRFSPSNGKFNEPPGFFLGGSILRLVFDKGSKIAQFSTVIRHMSRIIISTRTIINQWLFLPNFPFQIWLKILSNSGIFWFENLKVTLEEKKGFWKVKKIRNFFLRKILENLGKYFFVIVFNLIKYFYFYYSFLFLYTPVCSNIYSILINRIYSFSIIFNLTHSYSILFIPILSLSYSLLFNLINSRGYHWIKVVSI